MQDDAPDQRGLAPLLEISGKSALKTGAYERLSLGRPHEVSRANQAQFRPYRL